MHSDQLEPLLPRDTKAGKRFVESSRSASSLLPAGRGHYTVLATLSFIASLLLVFCYLQLRQFRLGFRYELYSSTELAASPPHRNDPYLPHTLRQTTNFTPAISPENITKTLAITVTSRSNDSNRDVTGNMAGLATATITATSTTQSDTSIMTSSIKASDSTNTIQYVSAAVTSALYEEDLLIVHYVRLFAEGQTGQLLHFVDCLGLYSVFLVLKPDRILLHTNTKDVWPFDNCETSLNKTLDWSIVQTILTPLQHSTNGTKITFIEHEADIRKLRALEEYGGVALDFDVVIINGSAVRDIWESTPCFVCWEPDRNSANLGFLGCRSRHARYPQLILQQYQVAYQPHCWSCNSGFVPWNISKTNEGN